MRYAVPAALIPVTTGNCDHSERLEQTGKDDQTLVFEVSDKLEALAQQRDADFTPWLKYTEIRDLPPMGDDRPG